MNMPFNIMEMYQQFRSNPMSFLAKRYNIPQEISSPQDIIQHLLNTNQVSQSQVNSAMQLRNDPQFKNIFR